MQTESQFINDRSSILGDLFGFSVYDLIPTLPPPETVEEQAERHALLDHARRAQQLHATLLRDFPRPLFGNANWMIMLACTSALLEGRLQCVKQIRCLIDESGTAVLRRIDTLEELALVGRRRDPNDGRRTHVLLTARGFALMREHLPGIAGDQTLPPHRH